MVALSKDVKRPLKIDGQSICKSKEENVDKSGCEQLPDGAATNTPQNKNQKMNHPSIFRNADEIIDRFELLDVLCTEENVRAEFVVLGASGILLYMDLQDRQFRSTRDIDVNLISSSNDKAIYELLKQLRIDLVGGVMDIPPMEDFNKDNLYKIDNTNFTSIDVYVPTIELLACAKIFTTRDKDLEDLMNSEIINACDKDKLLKMINEYKDYMLFPDNRDNNVHQLEEILKKRGESNEKSN